MWKIIYLALLCSSFQQFVYGTFTPETHISQLDIKDKKFQINFIKELHQLVDTAARNQLNQLLEELRTHKTYDAYAAQVDAAASAEQLEQKIVYLKQLLDIKLPEQWRSLESFYTLRNLNFLGKLKDQLQQLQEESRQELRQLRWYNLCRQVWFRDSLNQTKHTTQTATKQRRIGSAKLAPLRADMTATTSTLPRTAHIDLERFGSELYANVKAAGSEIIDDYLLPIRELLQEVVADKHIYLLESREVDSDSTTTSTANSDELFASKLPKLLTQIDAIVGIEDFYEKRNRLYDYLEHNMAVDFEQIENSQYAHEDLAVILAKLQSKGIDLFVTFIFSNFEFLELLHTAWAALLPPLDEMRHYDAQSQRLFDVHRLYLAYKRDWDNNERYEAYQQLVRQLHEDTRNGSANMHIFELLHNASANVGSVTFNVIKAKCDEL